jgi:hypothetical protein
MATRNTRYERFRPHILPFCPLRTGTVLKTPVGDLDGYGGLVKVTKDNELYIKLATGVSDGLIVDDVVALATTLVRSQPPNPWCRDAVTCMTAALYVLDKRPGVNIHFSEIERENPPDKGAVLPSLEEWTKMWHRLDNAL